MSSTAAEATGFADARRAAREHNDLGPMRARVPYAGFLGVELQMQDGAPQFRLPYRPSFIGNTVLPALHGGVVAGFMENAALLHLLLTLDEGRLPKSVDFSIDYLRSANAADCFAACDMARQGRRVAQVQIRCWQADAGSAGRQVAIARAHFLLTE
jgi:uncharacterized protein (TIGR00369 family)